MAASPDVPPDHSGGQSDSPGSQPMAWNAYSRPSAEPTRTRLMATVGGDIPAPGSGEARHRTCPVPASTAVSTPRADAAKTASVSLRTSGAYATEPDTAPSASTVQTFVPP